MIATVRLDNTLEEKLNNLAKNLHKKKSDIIRDAIEFYAINVEKNQKSRMLKAIEKTKEADKQVNIDFEGTISDAI
ncbi:MAG: ribbon-helix-helix protein, CopG family [Campylobacterota bacterium]|nr:ribbon-helix-helix protein, CopG family [Campylobacterota bacterium]